MVWVQGWAKSSKIWFESRIISFYLENESIFSMILNVLKIELSVNESHFFVNKWFESFFCPTLSGCEFVNRGTAGSNLARGGNVGTFLISPSYFYLEFFRSFFVFSAKRVKENGFLSTLLYRQVPDYQHSVRCLI